MSENIINNENSELEIKNRLRLYHQTSEKKWDFIQKEGAILSERELFKRGLITEEDLEDFETETTNTGLLDRQLGRDNYVFASHLPAGYGDITLEIDLEALQIENAKVSTAGEWLNFTDDVEYFHSSEIPATDFVKYLTGFIRTLPNPEWFWGKKDQPLEEFIGKAMTEKVYENNPSKFRQLWKLHPEIMFPRELSLKYVKNVMVKDRQ